MQRLLLYKLITLQQWVAHINVMILKQQQQNNLISFCIQG